MGIGGFGGGGEGGGGGDLKEKCSMPLGMWQH